MRKIIVSILLAFCLIGASVIYADGPTTTTKVLYDGQGYPHQQGQMYQLGRPITASNQIFGLTDSGATIDTTTDKAQLGGYYAIVPAIDHATGYTVTLRYRSDLAQKNRPTTQGLKFLITSHSQKLRQYNTIELVLWRDGVQIGHNFFYGLDDNNPKKEYTIGVKWDSYYIEGSAFIFYDFALYENQKLITKKRFFEVTPIIVPTDLGINPFLWDGWIWFGDDTKSGVVNAELQYLAIEYATPNRLYMPIVAKELSNE